MAQIFPKWSNKVPKVAIIGGAATFCFVVFVFWYWFSAYSLDVGYEPVQPVQYSHKLHAGNLGMDCRYCHAGVEKSAVAGVPPTQTCMNCHSLIKKDSIKLEKVIASDKTDKPIEWLRIHKAPDYVYFDHSAHINNGVGCASCHGRVDQMVRVRQEKPLSMGWCLDCHRNPVEHLRPLDKVTDMNWKPTPESIKIATEKVRSQRVTPPIESCSGCHR
jgi:hypothetical protein